jgi:hypothetical protein
VKVWYHLIAALVGLALAALIVYLVFGSASQQGAVQDGDAGSLAASEGLCGTIDAADINATETRELASQNLPALFDAQGPIPAIADSQPDQKDWVERVHAAGGLCLDEIRIVPEGATIAMSTVDSVDDDTARAYAAAVVAQAFTPPFSPRRVTVTATVGDSDRTIIVSGRAWRAYQVRRRQLGIDHSLSSLIQFRRATGQQFGPDLRILGWG